jgi:hypothetical protein
VRPAWGNLIPDLLVIPGVKCAEARSRARRSISTSTPQATSPRRVRGAHEIKHVAIAL